MSKEDMIKRINLVEMHNNGQEYCTLFDVDDSQYVVPLYQRAFAWGTEVGNSRENEIVQLMDDVMDVASGNEYYLGSLVVSKRENVYEVIDGQQRLTALYLIFHCIGLPTRKEGALSYACRDKSNYSLRRIDDLVEDESKLEAPYERSIYDGLKTIMRKISTEEATCPNYKKRMLEKLKSVVLFRICVPDGTDLNRYFEVMNTRGEQLEQHDIVKASLMSNLRTEEQGSFAEIWNACRDMSGYVQMHFNPNRRRDLFSDKWDSVPKDDCLSVLSDIGKFEVTTLKITEVIADSFSIDESNSDGDCDGRVRFESIIGFQHFLLHVLKVFVDDERICSDNPEIALLEDQIDDKKLIAAFKNVAEHGVVNGARLSGGDFARKYIACLLKCRFLFDKYILKREFKDDDSDGRWSIQELKQSWSGGSAKPYYVKTAFKEYGEWTQTWQPRNLNNEMIQSCLRVSYTSPKVMHWITALLKWLYAKKGENLDRLSRFTAEAERIARNPVSKFLGDGDMAMGVNTPHIVLNYTDYLIWKTGYNDLADQPFVFEFRNSVEHWYPQNPSEGTFQEWEEVHRIGNLCLVQNNINSKFSNMSPEAKKSTFEGMIAKGSLKLRDMAKNTLARDGRTSSENWRERDCAMHEDAILQMLREDCGMLEE